MPKSANISTVIFVFVISTCLALLAWTYRVPIAEKLFATQLATFPADAANENSYGTDIVLKADRSGHYFLEVTIDREHINFLIDTGATTTVLSYDDANALGFDMRRMEPNVKVNTGGGMIEMVRVTIPRLETGHLRVSNVDALVAPEGGMSQSVLGMNFLQKLKSYSVENGRMTLVP